MKYCMIIADGMADHVLEELGGKTCIEAADIPNIDYLSLNGKIGTVRTVPDGFTPGSDVAAMSLFGYDPNVYYTGRAPIEAVNIGVNLDDDDVFAFRCNFVNVTDGVLTDYSAGHITDKEAEILIKSIDDALGSDDIKFYFGNSYRHIMSYRSADKLELECMPPHDIMGQSVEPNLPKGTKDHLFIDLIKQSSDILNNHYVNKDRITAGKTPANMIWLWGHGKKLSVPKFKDKFGIDTAVISAVDLVNGLALAMGMSVISVPGATGNIDTDYEAKARYAIEALNDNDFVVVHIEAPDEMGHCGNTKEKVKAIENIDKKVLEPILESLRDCSAYRIMVLPDHYTPIVKRTHTEEPVPFVMFGSGLNGISAEKYSESNANKSKLHFEYGYELIDYFLNQNVDK